MRYLAASAELSPDGKYRYLLTRRWQGGTLFEREPGDVCFVMLNPSTADGRTDDPTIRRCVNFAARWGYQSLRVVNLFALRTAKPLDLLATSDPAGEQTPQDLVRRARDAAMVICAWGAWVPFDRDRDFLELVPFDLQLFTLGLTSRGAPRHPLYLRRDAAPIPWPRSQFLAPLAP